MLKLEAVRYLDPFALKDTTSKEEAKAFPSFKSSSVVCRRVKLALDRVHSLMLRRRKRRSAWMI